MNRKQRRSGYGQGATNPIAAQAKAEDRRWFAAHPSEVWRLRETVQGEFAPEWPDPDPDTKTYVYCRSGQQIFRAPLAPQEYTLVLSGQLELYPALIDGVLKWVARAKKAN